RAAVGDQDEQAVVRYVAGRQQLVDECDGACADLLVGFAAAAPYVLAAPPRVVLVGEAGGGLSCVQTRPLPEVDLPQARVSAYLQAEVPGRVDGPTQVGRHDSGRAHAGDERRGLSCLPPPDLVKRRVCLALEAAVVIPGGTTVPPQQDPHRE